MTSVTDYATFWLDRFSRTEIKEMAFAIWGRPKVLTASVNQKDRD